MPMVRCPECGRVADGSVCYACGYEWPAASAPAPTPPPPAAAPPAPPPSSKAQPPPIEEIGLGFEVPAAASDPASSSSNPFAAPRPVTGTFPSPSAQPDAKPAANPFHTAPSTAGRSNPFGTPRTEAAAGNPFASADGPLSAHASPEPEVPKATAAAPMAFDPFEGDSLPPAPPPPPLDLESEPFGEEIAFDDELDLDGPPAPAPAPHSTAAPEPTELLPRRAPGDADDVSFGMASTHADSDSLLDDDAAAEDAFDVDGLEIEEEPTVDTAHSPAYLAGQGGDEASREPLSERLILLAAELDAEGRHDDANLLHEAVRALASEKR